MLHEILNWILVAKIDWINNSTWWRGTWKSFFCHREKIESGAFQSIFCALHLSDVASGCRKRMFCNFFVFVSLVFKLIIIKRPAISMHWKAPSQKKKINWIALNVFQKSFKDFRIQFSPLSLYRGEFESLWDGNRCFNWILLWKSCCIQQKNEVIRH